jgi:hypothetical protein
MAGLVAISKTRLEKQQEAEALDALKRIAAAQEQQIRNSAIQSKALLAIAENLNNLKTDLEKLRGEAEFLTSIIANHINGGGFGNEHTPSELAREILLHLNQEG